jgi:hypothetical protein
MTLHNVFSHALLSRLVAYPVLLVTGAILEALAGPADMSSRLLTNHASTL